jgi:hypothetical protein
MKIRPVGAEMFHADGRTDGRTEEETHRHDEANGRCSKFLLKVSKGHDFPVLLIQRGVLFQISLHGALFWGHRVITLCGKYRLSLYATMPWRV